MFISGKLLFPGLEPVSFDTKIKNSWIWHDLKQSRNVRPSFNTNLGVWGGMAYTGMFFVLGRGLEPWTFSHGGKYRFFTMIKSGLSIFQIT